MASRGANYARSHILVLGSTSIQSLSPSTLIAQAESFLEAHRIEDAVKVAEQYRKKLQSRPVVSQDEADELRCLCQRIGFRCLKETLFDDAGRHLFDGDLDPRILISYFPDAYGSLLAPEDSVDVFAGVLDSMPEEESINEIIAANLVLNYSPHLSPNTQTALPAVELRHILTLTATDMLKQFLKKWRQRRKVMGGPSDDKTCMIVDTVLARLYSEANEKMELDALINESNFVLLDELEPVLIQAKQFATLFRMYGQRSADAKLVEALSRLVSGEWVDSSVEDPLSQMFALLGEKRNRPLVQQWGVWLTNRDPQRALKLLTSTTSGRRGTKAEDDQIVLKQLQETNPVAAAQFLEHLVLSKRSTNASLHDQLARSCVDQLLLCLTEESTSKLWRAKAASYASGRPETPYFSYFASTTPDSAPKHIRLKTMLFLQGSSFYDPHIIRERLQSHEKVLGLELAIVEGKCGNDRAALTTLVHGVRDFVSAEAYCTLGGDIIPAKTAQSFGERFNLQPWTSLFTSGGSSGGATALKKQKTVEDSRKRELTRTLLEVYMEGGEDMASQIAQLINSQSMNLEILDIIDLLPPSWPLHLLQDFLSRSFRRTLHAQHQGQLVKAISASQNLEVADQTWLILREQGSIIEEVVDDDEGDEAVEKVVSEKSLGLGLETSQPSVAEVSVSVDEKAGLRGYDVGDDVDSVP